MSDPYRTPGDATPDPGIIFRSSREEALWLKFLALLIEHNVDGTSGDYLDAADSYMLAWRERGGS
jgi:hypothetical protein